MREPRCDECAPRRLTGAGLAVFRFYEELNDFLPAGRRKLSFPFEVAEGICVGDAIADLGVPADAVDLVLVNGEPAEFSRPVRPGDRVSVYPVFESLDVSELARLPGRPLRMPRFLVARPLGRLARALQTLGFDARCLAPGEEGKLARLSAGEGRIVLTAADSEARHPQLTRVLRLRGATVEEQLAEVVERLDLRRGRAERG